MNDERSKDMARRHERGETFEQIGASYGLSRQRIAQLTKRVPKRDEAPVASTVSASDLAFVLDQIPLAKAMLRNGH